MKLDPLFKVCENKLCKIDGSKVEFSICQINDINNNLPLDKNSLYQIIVDQKQIEPEPECYNEEFLANLRDYLKVMEEQNVFAVLCVKPAAFANAVDALENDSYVACVKHATRRVKDCKSLAGIWICDEYGASGDDAKISFLIDELMVKHGHYVYFASESVLAKAINLGDEYSSKIVLV